MSTKKKVARLSLPVAVVVFGAFLILTKRASDGIAAPIAEGPIVVFAGVLLCLLGVWGFIATLRELKKKEDNPDAAEPVRDFE